MTHECPTQDPIILMSCNTLKERPNSDLLVCPAYRWHLQSLYSSSYEIALGMLLSRKCWSPSRVIEIPEMYIFFFLPAARWSSPSWSRICHCFLTTERNRWTWGRRRMEKRLHGGCCTETSCLLPRSYGTCKVAKVSIFCFLT